MRLVKLKVHPDSKRNAVARKATDSFEIWVKAPAQEGRANRAALAALAEALNEPTAKLHIVKGATSPGKIVRVFGGR